jgi:aryl sulfotransferase
VTELFREGGKTFMNKGTNGRWKGVLTEAELDQCRAAVERELTAECANWLEHASSYASTA